MSKLKLNLAHEAGEILSKEEMKNVLGGAGSSSTVGIMGSTVCAANKDWTQLQLSACFSNIDLANIYAGELGFVTCNTPEAYAFCGKTLR